jgi:hypothetical protein
MLRFSPDGPGLAPPSGGEPPPRSLRHPPETHTLFSRYAIVNGRILAKPSYPVKRSTCIINNLTLHIYFASLRI